MTDSLIRLSQEVHDLCCNNGISITQDESTLLVRHLQLVLEINKTTNLTAVTDVERALVLHIYDSLLYLPYLRYSSTFVDIGSGAGYPGIPLCICGSSKGTLIDSVGKKVQAIQTCIDEIGLGESCEARHIRAEGLAKERPSKFDTVVSRAVAQTNVLLEYASPLLCEAGHLVLSKAQLSDAEFEAGIRAANIVGMTLVSRETLSLPHDLGTREILCFEKTHEAKIRLPRKAGIAVKRPLGL